MTRVLLTGGTGTLGRELAPRLATAGYKVRIMSRRAGKPNLAGDTEWAQADLRTGEGLAEAVESADVVIHAASSPTKQTQETDVEGTRLLLEAARKAGASNFYYISIVGIDRVRLGYYAAKLAAERVIEQSGAPYTILRATQFHPLLDTFLGTLFRRGPFLLLPGAAKFQLIDPGEVADQMVATVGQGAVRRLPDIGGPKVQTAKEIASAWLRASGKRLIRVPVPAVGGLRDMARGYLTCPENAVGRVTWEEWLARKYGQR
jgi:uncharacterized protein YbjT (DUF2867 family)